VLSISDEDSNGCTISSIRKKTVADLQWSRAEQNIMLTILTADYATSRQKRIETEKCFVQCNSRLGIAYPRIFGSSMTLMFMYVSSKSSVLARARECALLPRTKGGAMMT